MEIAGYLSIEHQNVVNHSFVGKKIKSFKNSPVIEMQHASIQPDDGQLQ